MCLIIEKPVGQIVPIDIIKSAMSRNRDGVGMMCNGSFDKWLDIKAETIEEKLTALKDQNAAVHFRMGTHGPTTRKNAHPFALADGSLLMHNGVISNYSPDAHECDVLGWSDTVKFIHRFINPHIAKHGAMCPETVSDAAGYSAFLHMDRDGKTTQFGDGWCQHFGLWFSNEYAWNSPRKQKSYWQGYDSIYDKYGSQKSGYDCEYQDHKVVDNVLDFTDDENMVIGETVREYLLAYVDSFQLDYSNYSSIVYEDLALLDQVIEGTITGDTFLRHCTAQTAMHLFVKLSHNTKLPSPNY